MPFTSMYSTRIGAVPVSETRLLFTVKSFPPLLVIAKAIAVGSWLNT